MRPAKLDGFDQGCIVFYESDVHVWHHRLLLRRQPLSRVHISIGCRGGFSAAAL